MNDAPTLTGLDATSLNMHIQGGAAVVIDANAVLADLDLQALGAGSGNWSGSTLTIGRQTLASADDVFGASGSLGSISAASGNLVISGTTTIGTYTNAGGTLTLTFNANATTALVNTALNGITYRNAVTTPGALGYNALTLDFTFNDQNPNTTGGGTAGSGQDQGNGGQLGVTASITVNIDRLPFLVADTNSVSEGVATTDVSTTTGNVLGNDSDPDSDPMTVQGVATGTQAGPLSSHVGSSLTGSYGSINLAADGSYTYTLNNGLAAVQALAVGEHLTDTFSYTADDGRGGKATTTLTITINGTNDAPQILIGSGDTIQLTTGSSTPTFRLAIPVSGVAAGDLVRLSYMGQTQVGQVLTASDISHGYVDVQLSLALQDAASSLAAVPVKWVDWTSYVDSGATHTVSGTFTTTSGTVGATLTNSVGFAFVQINGGTNYFSPTVPYESTGVAAPTTPDIIAFNAHGTRTLTFTQPVTNLYFAYVSLNGNGYVFDQDFDILSQGAGYWGSGGTAVKTTVVINGKTYYELNGVSGEPHGVILFKGTFSAVTWTTLADENWNGFTVGIKSSLNDLQNVQGQFVNGANTVLANAPTTLVTYDPSLVGSPDPKSAMLLVGGCPAAAA